ncbi:MAG: ATP-binding cassette domain-containing protein [Fibrobacter sp.]|nr:ATP-binding cassette domain-containing protein [Fibrobacter sp.]
MRSFQIITPEADKPFTIGRKSDNSLVLDNLMVSRQHAVLECKAGNWTLLNLTGNSITQLNGSDVPVNETRSLKDGDVVLVGTQKLQATLKDRRLSLLVLASSGDSETELPEDITANVSDGRAHLSFKQKLVTFQGKTIRSLSLSENESIQIPGYEIEFAEGKVSCYNAPQGFGVTARHLDIFAGKKQLVNDLNFSLPAGEIMAIIGRSGQGKSTLLRLLQGIHKSGERSAVRIGGLDYRNEEIRKHIAFLEQDPELRRDLTVRETLLDGGRTSMNKLDFKANAISRMEKFCLLFGLTERIDNLVKTLSGGELRRVALARELMGNPGLIVLDEPLSGLDPYNAKILCTHLQQLSFLGHTVILTTHSYEALDIANKVLVLHHGEQGFYGSPQDAFRYFNTKDPEEILSDLNDDSATSWKNSWESLAQKNAMGSTQEMKAIESAQKEHNLSNVYFIKNELADLFLYKIALTCKQWFRDTGKTLTLIFQPLIIGFLFSLIFSNLTSLWIVAFAIILSANWLALSLSIREIVQERQILQGEFRKGVKVLPTLLSKITLPTLVAWLQTLVVYAFVSYRISAHVSIAPLFLATLAMIIPAVTVGLTVSAFSKNAGQANAVLPLLIIPQVALAGALVPLDQMMPLGRALSYVIWSRYNQNSLLNLFLERQDPPENVIAAIAIAVGFYIVMAIKLYRSKNAK